MGDDSCRKEEAYIVGGGGKGKVERVRGNKRKGRVKGKGWRERVGGKG